MGVTMNKLLFIVAFSVLAFFSSTFAAQQTLTNCKVLSVQIFGADYAADNNHKAGQMQVQIDPHGIEQALACNGEYITSIEDNTSNFALITATLEKALSERRYVTLVIANDNETYPGRCRIVCVVLTNVTY
jgi:hypothetical protein